MRLILAFLLLFSGFGYAQMEWPSLSPEGTLTQVVGNTTISIRYERPAARGRKIFGELVPWGKVWRTGAGYCTRIRFSQPVRVGNQWVEAGTYSLFTLPQPDQWRVMLNTDTTLYGSYDYDPDKDVARFKVIPTTSQRYYESLTLDLDVIPNSARLYISWTDVQVSFDIEIRDDKEIMAYIETELLTGKSQDPEELNMASDYLYYQRQDLYRALALAEKAEELDPKSGFAVTLQVLIYEEMGYYEKALEALKRDWAITEQKDLSEKDKQVEREYWERIEARIRGKWESEKP